MVGGFTLGGAPYHHEQNAAGRPGIASPRLQARRGMESGRQVGRSESGFPLPAGASLLVLVFEDDVPAVL
jgi:hypothetical protein